MSTATTDVPPVLAAHRRPDRAVRDVLVERVRRRDPQVWEAAYLRLYPRLHAFAARRLPVGQAKDAVAETMARAVAAAARFDVPGTTEREPVATDEAEGLADAFDAWVFGICRHVVLDAQRAGRRRTGRAPKSDAPPDGEHGARLEAGEEGHAVLLAYARLSPSDRELLDLRILGGLSSEQVATLLGRKPGSVRMAQARALDRLRRIFLEVHGAND